MIDQEEEVKDKDKSYEKNENSEQNHQLQLELNSEIDQESEKESQQENNIVHMNNLVYTKLNFGRKQPEVQKILKAPEPSNSEDEYSNLSDGEFSLPSIDE